MSYDYDSWKLDNNELIETAAETDAREAEEAEDEDDECEVCQGTGTVTIENVWTVDGGTKWARYYRENLLDECPECDGAGFLVRK